MKKSLFLTLAVGALGAAQAMAATYDLYITGSTAFRAQVYTACGKLYDNGAPISIFYGTSVTGGNSPQSPLANNTQWTMSGTVSNIVTAMGTGNTLNIHAFFTGSVQGMQTVEQEQKVVFVDAAGNAVTNSPTIAYSDVDASATPYPVPGLFSDCAQATVCVQPFVMCKSVATVGSVSNVTWDLLRSAIQPGRLPLSTWTHNPADHSSFVYLVQRTKDSGTRRTELAEVQFSYNQSAGVYLFDAVTNQTFWKPPVAQTVIVGSAGVNNINLNWGSGYVAGSDVRTALQQNFAGNQSIAILSMADARTETGVNWEKVIPFNNTWPTAAGPGLSGNITTNDFTPISLGQYPLWAYEVCVYPTVDPSSRAVGDQNLSHAQLGDTASPGTILYVLNNVSAGTPLTGSIEAEIEASKSAANGATAIRLKDMTASRASVGSTITP